MADSPAKGAPIDRVGVLVLPDVSKFMPDLRKTIEKVERQVKATVQVVADATRLSRETSTAAKAAGAGAKVDVALNAVSDGFASQVRSDIRAAVASAEANIPLTADGERLRREMQMQVQSIQERARQLEVEIPLDLGEAARARAELRAEIARLQGMAQTNPVEVPVKVDRAIGQVRASVGNDGSISRVGSDANIARGAVVALVGALAGILPAIVPIAGVAAGAFGALAFGALSAASGIGVAIFALGGVVDAVKASISSEEQAAGAAKSSGAARASAADSVASAQAALRDAEASAAESSIRSARAVEDAQRGLTTARRDAGRAAAQAARQVADAERAVADAQRSSQDAARSLADAREQAALSVQSATERVTAAVERFTQAQEREADATRSVKDAQDALTQSRVDAQRALEDLNDRTRDGALSERSAELAVQKARKAIERDGGKTRLGDIELQLDLDRAIANLEEVRQQNKRLAEDKKKADKQGVEGSDQVQNAQQRVTDALEDQRDASKAVADARQDITKAENDLTRARRDGARQVADAQRGVEDASRRVADAQRDLSDARREQGEVAVDSAERIADAQRRVTDALRAQKEAARQAKSSVEGAQRSLASALRSQADAAGASSAATDKAAAAMAALSPAGRDFVRYLLSLRPALKALRDEAAENFLPGLMEGMKSAGRNLQPLRDALPAIAKAMGDVMAAAGRAFGDKVWQDFFTMLGQTAPRDIRAFGKIIGDVTGGFAGLAVKFRPVVDMLIVGIAGIAASFRDWSTTDGGSLDRFIEWMVTNGPSIASSLGSIIRGVGDLILAFAPIGLVVLPVLADIAEWFSGLPAGVQTAIAVVLTLIGPISSVISIVGLVGKAIAGVSLPMLLVIGLVALVAGGFFLLYTKSEEVRGAVDKLWQSMQDLWAALQPIFQAVADAVKKHLPEIKAAFEDVKTTVSTVLGFLDMTIQGFVSGVEGIWARWGENIKKFTDGAMSGSLQFVRGGLEAIRGTFVFLGGLLSGDWSMLWSGLQSIVSGGMTAMSGLIRGGAAAAQLAMSVVWDLIVQAVNSGVQKVGGALTGLGSTLIAAFMTLPTQMGAIGGLIIDGLVWGIKWSGAKVGSAVGDVAKQAIDSAKQWLGIASPSKVFKQLGVYTGEGFVIGIEGMSPAAQKAMKSMVDPPSAQTIASSSILTRRAAPLVSGRMAALADGRTMSDLDVGALAEAMARRPMYPSKRAFGQDAQSAIGGAR